MSERAAVHRSPPREPPSRPYVPTEEEAFTSALCHALASAGATERQAIDCLFRRVRELEAQCRRLLETEARPMIVRVDGGGGFGDG